MKVKVKRLLDCGSLRYQFSTLSDDSVLLGEAFEIIEIEYLGIETEERAAYVHIQRIPSEYNPNTKRLISNYNMHVAMDDLAADLSVVSNDILQSDERHNITDVLHRNDLYYISLIRVEEKYRNQGIGRYVLRQLKKIIKRHTHDRNPIIVLVPSPIEFDKDTKEYSEMKNRLQKWYMRNGFCPLGPNAKTMILED